MRRFVVSGASPRVAALSLAVALLASLVPIVSVSAAVGVTGAQGGSMISADTNPSGSNTYTTLIGPVVQEGAAGDLVVGQFDLKLPSGFQFLASSASVSVNAGCNLGLGAITTSATDLIIPVTAKSTVNPCTLTVSNLAVQPTAGNPLKTGNISNSTGTTGPTGANYGVLTEVPGQPTLTFSGANIVSNTGGGTLTNPMFHDEDTWGNNRQNESVSLAIKAGTGTAGATLDCATNPKNTNGSGDVTFTMCTIDKAGLNYQLRATTTGGAFADTNMFNVSVGVAAKLVFTSYPGATTPSALTPQPAVSVTDLGGNVVTTDNSTVVTIAISSNVGTFSCSGGLSRTVSSGTGTYSGCQQTSTGTYTLSATSNPAHGTTTGATFQITSGPASKLALCWGTALNCPQTPPSPNTGGTALSTQPTIRVEDVAGNTVTSDSTTVVTLSIAGGTPTSGGPGTLTCTGGNSKTVTNGIATFSGCTIDKVGTGYRLMATSVPVFTSATSDAFNVVAGSASKLTFTSQPPTTVNAGSAFPSPVLVAITDAGGNVITTGIAATISLAFGNNPGSATLACNGGNTSNTLSGVATFSGCTVSAQGVGYTLTATALATAPVIPLAPAASTTFNVTAPAAAISLTPSPSNGVIVWGNDVTFTIHFAVNGAGKVVALQVSKDGINWSTISGASALVTNGGGDATFVYGPSDNRYYRAVFSGTPDLSAGMSSVVRVVVRQTNQLRPTNDGRIKSVGPGTTVLFKSTIRPNRPELPQPRAEFVVYQLVGATWIKVSDVIIDANRSDGVATFSRTFNGIGRFYVRSQAVPTPQNANSGWSQIEQYRVV
jgi:hypothetical protein